MIYWGTLILKKPTWEKLSAEHYNFKKGRKNVIEV